MSLLDGDVELSKFPGLSRASRKGIKFFQKGLPLSANPYTNPKRREQFIWAWEESKSASEWDAVLSDGLT